MEVILESRRTAASQPIALRPGRGTTLGAVERMATMVEWVLRTPLSRVSLLVVIALALLVGGRLADTIGWRRWGTRLALAGLGAALIPTFVSRIGYFDFAPNWRAVNDCLGGVRSGWTDPEGMLNLLLLVPMAVGLILASRSWGLSVTLVIAVAIGVELAQSVTGMGACQRGDMVRNSLGGIVAATATWLVLRASRPTVNGLGDSVAPPARP